MQLAVLGGITIMIYGVNVQALPAMNLRMYGHIEPGVVLWPCLLGAAGMLLFATKTAATFAMAPNGWRNPHRKRRTISIDDNPESP